MQETKTGKKERNLSDFLLLEKKDKSI